MRRITEQSIKAFANGQNFKKSNMKVRNVNGIRKLYLFDNLIAEMKGNKLKIYDGGFQSVTTKERLNGLLYEYSLNKFIFQKDFDWYIGNDHKTAKVWHKAKKEFNL